MLLPLLIYCKLADRDQGAFGAARHTQRAAAGELR